jgi:hypothetical protein
MKFFYWFRVVFKILIPVVFFLIANSENKVVANALAGFMTIVVLFYIYLFWKR